MPSPPDPAPTAVGCAGGVDSMIRSIKPRYILKYRIAGHPMLFPILYPLLPFRKDKASLVSRATDIVIEGFPRSGNTFAVIAFLQAQQREVIVAHHLHHEAQVLVGARWGLPVLVLIREPTEAISSLILREPSTTVRAALERYIEFYTKIGRVSDRVVIANFTNVVRDYGQVIERVNSKFGTSFTSYLHTPQNQERVFQEIERINQEFEGGNEYAIPRPSKVRQAAYQDMHVAWPQALRDEARRLYGMLG
jgi:hypothetical protein